MEEEVHLIRVTAERLAVGPSYFVGNRHSFLSFVKMLITAAELDIVAIKVVGHAGKTHRLNSNYYQEVFVSPSHQPYSIAASLYNFLYFFNNII